MSPSTAKNKTNQQKLNKQKALTTQWPQLKRKFTITKQIFILLKHSSWNTADFLQIRLRERFIRCSKWGYPSQIHTTLQTTVPKMRFWSKKAQVYIFQRKKASDSLSMAISLLTFKLKVTSIVRVLSRKFFFQWFGLKSLNICSGKLYLKQIFSTGHQRILPNCTLNQYFTILSIWGRERK